MNPNSEMYNYIKVLVNTRKANQVWSSPHIERWCSDNIYAFTRGNVLIVLTNLDNTQNVVITYHPYTVGVKLCNQFNTSDCVIVRDDNKIAITLVHGEAKLYVPVKKSEESFLE